MNESDLISAYHEAEEIWQNYVSIFISVLFGYLAVAYLVGAKLSRIQAYIVTGLYALFSASVLLYLAIAFGRMQDFGTDIYETNPDRTNFASFDTSGPWFGNFMLWGPFFGAFLAGLVFMFQIRHKAKKRAETVDEGSL